MLIGRTSELEAVAGGLHRLEGAVGGERGSGVAGVLQDSLVVVAGDVAVLADERPQQAALAGRHLHLAEQVAAG